MPEIPALQRVRQELQMTRASRKSERDILDFSKFAKGH